MAMDVKGITWVGNIYRKFENMCLEVEEDIMFEDAIKYVENQMQTVGENVKKLYSDVMQDLLPSPASDLCTDAGLCKKEFQGFKKIIVKDDTKQKNEHSRINHDIDDDVTFAEYFDTDAFMSACGNSMKGDKFISHARQYVRSTDVTSNLGSDEIQQNKKMPTSSIVSEITLLETDTCWTSQSRELSNENQNHAVTISKLDSAGVTRLASAAGCCNEIEITSDEQVPNVLVLVKSDEEKEMNTSSSSSVLLGDPDETWSLDATNIDTGLDHGHDDQKLEETCVMVTTDELRLVPKARANLMTNKKKMRQPFSLSKKSARKQEYEELAILHANNAKGKGDCMENLSPTFMEDQKKSLLPDISEAEWELL